MDVGGNCFLSLNERAARSTNSLFPTLVSICLSPTQGSDPKSHGRDTLQDGVASVPGLASRNRHLISVMLVSAGKKALSASGELHPTAQGSSRVWTLRPDCLAQSLALLLPSCVTLG